MQSQQKKVKWSRGETADALEERTDTGITQVSVSKLENIIADIYGNISRRPAFKIISHASPYNKKNIPVVSWHGGGGIDTSDFMNPPQYFVFTVDANTYIIFITNALRETFGGFLIQNEKFVKKVKITNNTGWSLNWALETVSAAQYNNFMVVSNLYLGDVVLRLTDTNDITVEPFQFSAPWYAPGGTQTKTVHDSILSGLEFNKDGVGFTAFSWTDRSGNASPYSLIDTGLDSDTTEIEEAIPVGSIVKFPNLGTYMRVEGYQLGGHTIYFGDYDFDSTSTNRHPSATGLCADISNTPEGTTTTDKFRLIAYRNGVEIGRVKVSYGQEVWVRCSSVLSGYRKVKFTKTQVGNVYTYTAAWEDVSSSALDVQMFGPLLTPVANGNAKDSSVTVEYGYISLDTYMPTQFAFSNQRLYAAGFFKEDADIQQIPGYAVGSQIAKYNDFKNDYNTQSEAVVIDISTAYQEQIVAMIDYNGLKLLTDAAEYAYTAQGVIKQSENGTLATCKPIVFGSVCLYADKSGGQIRAMQYEFQSDLFSSSSINQMAKEDLIFNTTAMAGFLDKEHFSGRFLYAIQFRKNPAEPIAEHALAVCNMVPGNQTMIWGRWTSPNIVTETGLGRHTVAGALEVNNKVWFIVACYEELEYEGFTYRYPGYTIAELDYEGVLDFEQQENPTNTNYKLIPQISPHTLYAWTESISPHITVYTRTRNPVASDPVYDKDDTQIGTVDSIVGDTITFTYLGSTRQAEYNQDELITGNWAVLPNATVSVFDGDEYKWDDTLDEYGNYTKPLTDLEHPRVGFMINATLESHPIDIQGKTYTEKKRIGKAVAVVRNTEPNAFKVCDKTGYMSPDKKSVNFYGCTGMKDLVRYTIKNIQGAKFTIESLTMIIEHGTLDS